MENESDNTIDCLSSEIIQDNAKFNKEQFNNYVSNPFEIAKEALNKMHEKNYCHDDICWRHVALLPTYNAKDDIWTVCPIMIDLAGITVIEKSTSAEWVRRGLEGLQTEMEDNLLQFKNYR